MRAVRPIVAVLAAATLLIACDDDDSTVTEDSSRDTTTSSSTTTEQSSTSETTTSQPVELEQPAIWPAPEVTFDTPEAAAEDFVTQVLGVPPALGEFRQGDSRSGEIELLSPREGDAGPQVVRGVLLLRQLGPRDGWFLIGVANDNATIDSPAALATVATGQLTVEGRARGFEANVVVSAFVAGDAGSVLDSVVTQGGSAETPEPFSVTLDLSAAAPGETVVILVRGGTGLETDPGELGAIPVVIGS